MFYYDVWVAGKYYHGMNSLTYASESYLQTGSAVIVPLKNRQVPGVVINEINKPKNFSAKKIIRNINDTPLPNQLIQLAKWLIDYYPAPLGQIISIILPSGLVAIPRNKLKHNYIANKPSQIPSMTSEQQHVLSEILGSKSKNILLHGDTGTGKTRVYLELAKNCVKNNKSAIILTPEIGLTPQLALESQRIFPNQIVVLHSNMTPSARREAWYRILETPTPLIIIGPRSALFAPIKDIGLIVIDESHETSYKQEQSPRYLATRVGAKLAELHSARFILASATPSVSDYYFFKKKNLPIIRMRQPAIMNKLEDVKINIIDFKNRHEFNKSPWLSNALIGSINRAIYAGNQALVFLNRRGAARLTACKVCGWQARCPRCDLPLTYHNDLHKMQCHTCGYIQDAILKCADCDSSDIIFQGAGTKTIVSEIERLIPGATIARFDSDNKKNESLEQQYSVIKNGNTNVLVGTQLLSKGLDLPKLSVLGIVLAETSLSFPDYTAEERTFQLLAQALGRINRGHIQGEAIIQTYNAESNLIRAAITKDYKTFYEQQIRERKLYKFPPFCFTLKLSCFRKSRVSAERSALNLKERIISSGISIIEIIGPVPAFLEKTHDTFHWQLIIKSNQRKALTQLLKLLPANWHYDLDPMNLL